MGIAASFGETCRVGQPQKRRRVGRFALAGFGLLLFGAPGPVVAHPVLAHAALAHAPLAQGMPRPSKVTDWKSTHNVDRLKADEQVLPEYKEKELPDGTKVKPRAPWPFVVLVSSGESEGSRKIDERVLSDTRFVLATGAVKLVRIPSGSALDVPYLASVTGLRDPSLVFVNRDFEVVGALTQPSQFEERGVFPILTKLADQEYTVRLGSYLTDYVKIMEAEELLWRDDEKLAELQRKAASAPPAKQEKYDAEADELEARIQRERDALLVREDALRGSLRLVEAKPEALPTTTGRGSKKRKITPEESEAIATFRQYARDENPHVRAAAVEDLGTLDSPAMVEQILEAARDRDARVIEAAARALGRMKSAESLEAVLSGLSSSDARMRRAALLGVGRLEVPLPAAVALVAPLVESGDEQIRRAAIQALSRHAGKEQAAPFVKALEDPLPALRVLAAEALGKLKVTEAALPLCARLDDADWAVRKAAAEALGRLRVRESIQPLLEHFESAEGLLVEVMYQALVAVTGQNFPLDRARWRWWWDEYGAGYRLLTDEEIEDAKRRSAEAIARYEGPDKKTYHEIVTLSQRLLFVIDISASMRDKITIPPGTTEKELEKFPSRVKIDIAKKELIELLAGLDENTRFNIVTFAGEVQAWKPGLVGASARTAAIKFVTDLKAMEPPTRVHGRVVAVAGEEQKTDTYAALGAALGISGDSDKDWQSRSEVDTVFFLTDGLPTKGEIVDVNLLIETFSELNRTRGVVIHLILFEKEAAERLRPLAERNGGQCVVRGFQ
ncbi:MAG: HEAT repeat domain-containing protein [Planctomycetota bacterium]